MLNQVYPLAFSGDHEYLISIGPMIVSKPYPTAYPEYLGIEIQSTVSKSVFAKFAEKLNDFFLKLIINGSCRFYVTISAILK
jgi:hypothetical protein